MAYGANEHLFGCPRQSKAASEVRDFASWQIHAFLIVKNRKYYIIISFIISIYFN